MSCTICKNYKIYTHQVWFCTETVKILHTRLNFNKTTTKINDLCAFSLFLILVKIDATYAILVCKNFGPKIWSCKFFDKSQVCKWDTYILPLIWYINCVRSEDICLFLHDTYTAVCKKWRHIRRNLTAAAMAPILNAWETGPRGILGLSINDYHVTIIIWKRGFKMSTILDSFLLWQLHIKGSL